MTAKGLEINYFAISDGGHALLDLFFSDLKNRINTVSRRENAYTYSNSILFDNTNTKYYS